MSIGVGCSPHEPQRLEATGQLVAADGQTPLPNTAVDDYELTFKLLGENGEVSISRAFEQDAEGDRITTDPQGIFRIEARDLRLSYDWSREELECRDECIAWETLCETVTEEVCYSTCSEEQCWDECYDDCYTDCWEEEYCDDDGCWGETVCEDDCVEVCEPTCETVSYACDCQWESYEVCSDSCVLTEEVCEWVTRWYTAYPALSEVQSTTAAVRLPDKAGNLRILKGDNINAHQHQQCDENGCLPIPLWVQDDRFRVPWSE